MDETSVKGFWALIKLPYSHKQPMFAALKISKILKEEYSLVHSEDFTWHFDNLNKNLIIQLSDKHASLGTMIAMRFAGIDLYEFQK